MRFTCTLEKWPFRVHHRVSIDINQPLIGVILFGYRLDFGWFGFVKWYSDLAGWFIKHQKYESIDETIKRRMQSNG